MNQEPKAEAEKPIWIPVFRDDELWSPPDVCEMPPTLLDPAPVSLNTHEIPWETFERLALTMARQLDGALDVRVYGIRGQAQEGIDLVAFFDANPTTVYQVKRTQNFSAAQLEIAVKKYADGDRPFSATRLVVVVACDACETTVIKMLSDLRSIYSDLTIELWDRTELSERLANQHWIVRRFFGPAIANRFCGVGAPTEPPSSPIEADAIIRGPIRHLGLADDLIKADQYLETDPTAAATLLGSIAARLDKSPFSGHGVQIRRRQAMALEKAGLFTESFDVRLDLAWRLVDSTDLLTAHVLLLEMGRSEMQLPDNLVRSAQALSELVQFRREHTGSLETLAIRFDELLEADPHRQTAAIAFAEESVAAYRTDLVRNRAQVFLELADVQVNDYRGQMVSARLHMCVADSTGNWQHLTQTARELYEPAIVALVLARHARYSAMMLNPEMAITRYLDAVERSTEKSKYGDAAMWLYAIRTVRIQYGLVDGSIDDLHPLAQTLQTLGVESVLPASDPRERAFVALVRRKWPDALEALRRFLWHAVVTASWTEEIEANELLGDVFAETGRPMEAAAHYIRAGAGKKAAALTSRLDETTCEYGVNNLGNTPWERAAAYEFIASVSDLLVDTVAKDWAAMALKDMMNHPANGLTEGRLGIEAFKAFGSLSNVVSEDDASQFLHFAAGLVDREVGHHRLTDRAHVEALVGISHHYSSLRARAIQQALDLLLLDPMTAQIVLTIGGELLRQETAIVEERLTGSAKADHHFACLALVIAGGNTTAAIGHARVRLAGAIAERVHETGVQHIGTGHEQDAVLISILDTFEQESFVNGMMTIALDPEEPAQNRQEALLAAAELVAQLPATVTERIFQLALECARGERDTPASFDTFEGPSDPLSRFQIHFGDPSLRPYGLRCAAEASKLPENVMAVRQIALELLQNCDSTTANHVAYALHSLPAGVIARDIEILGSHSSEWVKSWAAVAWAASDELPLALGQRLAADSSLLVRRSLASALRNISRHAAVRDVLANDVRRSVRSRAVTAESKPTHKISSMNN